MLSYCTNQQEGHHRRALELVWAIPIRQITSGLSRWLLFFTSTVPVTSRVLHRSILAFLRPLLFIIFINDLPGSVQSATALLLADDTKGIKHIISTTDSTLLLDDLNALADWSSRWVLSFITSKCPNHMLSGHTYIINNHDSDNTPSTLWPWCSALQWYTMGRQHL